MNICWFEDDDLGIFFNSVPDVEIRIITPMMSEKEIKEVSKKPFINKTELAVVIKDKIDGVSYVFTIPKNYTWDGATIPRIFWRLIGSKTDNKFLIPSMIHDFICENKDDVDNDRYLSSLIFDKLLVVSRVNPINRFLIKHTVDNFQKFCGW